MYFVKKITVALSVILLLPSLIVAVMMGGISQASTVHGAKKLHPYISLHQYIKGATWSKCDKQFLCAKITAPLSYTNSKLGTIKLAVIELPAKNNPSASDIFVNPGGPGVAGVNFLESYYSQFPASLRNNFNLVSWDPRGVGQSDPVSCESTPQLRSYFATDPYPANTKEVKQVISSTKAFVNSCLKNTPKSLLANISTSSTARDLNLLRIDLGQSKLNYLGFSYGTYLGQVYAQMFPGTIRAMALDGVVDPALSTLQLDSAQAAGFESELNAFFSYCNGNSTCSSGLPGGTASQYRQIMRSFRDGSTVIAQLKPQYGGNITVNYGIALLGVIGALYSPHTWDLLGVGLGDVLSQGAGQVLAGLAFSYEGLQLNGKFSNQAAANTAISCVDRPGLSSLSQLEKDANTLSRKYPDFGGPAVWGSLPCLYWPVKPESHPSVIHAPLAPTILLVGSTGDPATPYQWAQAVSKQLDHSVLLTRIGNGHIGYFSSKCVANYVDNYFTSLQLPKKNTTCH